MINTLVAQLILQERNVAYAVTDQQLLVQEVGGNVDLLATAGQAAESGAALLDLAPELIGYEADLQAILTGARPSFQLALVNRENAAGKLCYVHLHHYAYVADNQEITGVLHIVEDVTLIGEAHQHVTQQRNELLLLHEQLTRANLKLAAANAELRALDELKSRFVSIAAHELRTPLASIMGYVDFTLNDPVTALHPDHRTSVEIIGKSAKRLLAITNNLLDVTRIETGHLELTLAQVDLVEIIQEVALHFQPELDQKQHSFTLETQPALPAVLCDETRTAQIFSNLLSNAIKYTPEQGQIMISLHYAPTEAAVVAAVADNGIGIPASDLQNIGKNFFRASNVHLSRANGAGLGLNITRSLVELQGGRLWIESTPGKGSTFYVTLPVDDNATAE